MGGVVDGSSPAVSSDGTIYIGSLGSFMYAVSPQGSVRWKLKTDGMIQSSAAIDEGERRAAGNATLYFASFKASLYAVDAASGAVQWTARIGSTSFSSPAIGRRGVYVGANDGGVYGWRAAAAAIAAPQPPTVLR